MFEEHRKTHVLVLAAALLGRVAVARHLAAAHGIERGEQLRLRVLEGLRVGQRQTQSHGKGYTRHIVERLVAVPLEVQVML